MKRAPKFRCSYYFLDLTAKNDDLEIKYLKDKQDFDCDIVCENKQLDTEMLVARFKDSYVKKVWEFLNKEFTEYSVKIYFEPEFVEMECSSRYTTVYRKIVIDKAIELPDKEERQIINSEWTSVHSQHSYKLIVDENKKYQLQYK